MANDYSDIKMVREKNGDVFLSHFKMLELVVWVPLTGVYLKTQKQGVWNRAKHKKIRYELSNLVYQNRRNVMVIL